MEVAGFEPAASHMRSERSTTELNPQTLTSNSLTQSCRVPQACDPNFCQKSRKRFNMGIYSALYSTDEHTPINHLVGL